MTKKQLELKGVLELRELCRSLEIAGYSGERKDGLIKLLLKYYRKANRLKTKKTVNIVKETPQESYNCCEEEEKEEEEEEENEDKYLEDDEDDIETSQGDTRIISIPSTKTLLVSHGANNYNFPNFVGKEIIDIRVSMTEALNLSSTGDYTTLVDGESKNSDYTFTGDEQRLEFLKEAGSKGVK